MNDQCCCLLDNRKRVKKVTTFEIRFSNFPKTVEECKWHFFNFKNFCLIPINTPSFYFFSVLFLLFPVTLSIPLLGLWLFPSSLQYDPTKFLSYMRNLCLSWAKGFQTLLKGFKQSNLARSGSKLRND